METDRGAKIPFSCTEIFFGGAFRRNLVLISNIYRHKQ